MTDDLVKRLRGETEWTNQKPYFHAHTKCLEAADRIEELTAEVAAYGRSLELKQALIEELTAALVEIRACTTEYGGAAKALRIINAALEKQP